MPDPNVAEKERHAAATAAALAAVYTAAKADVLERLAATGDAFRTLRRIWRDAVQSAAREQIGNTANDIGSKGFDDFNLGRLDAYLDKMSHAFADAWYDQTSQALDDIALQIDQTYNQILAEVQEALDAVVDQAGEDGVELTERSANFAAIEAAEQQGRTTKTWHLGAGDNHRASHIALNGTTIPIGERFANGLPYPHAPGPPAEVANCNCYLTFGGGDDA